MTDYLKDLYHRNAQALKGKAANAIQGYLSDALAGASLPLAVALDQVIPEKKRKEIVESAIDLVDTRMQTFAKQAMESMRASKDAIRDQNRMKGLQRAQEKKARMLAGKQKPKSPVGVKPQISKLGYHPANQVLTVQMPKAKGKKGKKGGKLKGKPKRQGKGMAVKGQSQRILDRVIAPATTYSGVYNSGQYVRFSAGDRAGDLRLHYRTRVLAVQIAYDGSGNPELQMVKGSTVIAGTFAVCPANNFFFPAPLQTFASLFTKWKMENTCFEFVPRVAGGTSTGLYMTWAWTNDPVYPDEHGWTYSSGHGWYPLETQVAMLPNAKQFPTWVPSECMRVTTDDPKRWLYSIASDLNAPISTNDVVSDVRAQYSGMMVAAGNENTVNTSAANSTVMVGNIYVEGTFQFSELTAAISQDPSLQRRKRGGLVDTIRQVLSQDYGLVYDGVEADSKSSSVVLRSERKVREVERSKSPPVR